MSQLALYPGSFDPITLGHISVLTRAAKVFQQVEIVVVHNPAKKSNFSIESRVELIRASLEELSVSSNISISSLGDGLLAEHAKKLGANAIIKGFRTTLDLEHELPMAQVNRELSGVETIFFPAESGFGFVSSSLVREVASLGGDVSNYVTKAVSNALIAKIES